MRRKIMILVMATMPFLGIDCLLENYLSDVEGWNLSACVDGFDTCWELYRDNEEKFPQPSL